MGWTGHVGYPYGVEGTYGGSLRSWRAPLWGGENIWGISMQLECASTGWEGRMGDSYGVGWGMYGASLESEERMGRPYGVRGAPL